MPNPKDLTPAELEWLYNEQRLSTVAIGKMFGLSDEAVRRRMKTAGIARRTFSQAAAGDLNSQYKDGSRVGEHEHGHQRKGWNPWNRGKSKENDPQVAAVAAQIRAALAGHPSAFKPRAEWTQADCCFHTSVIASSLRTREANLYEDFLALLSEEWVTEHFQEEFTYQRGDGLWQGYIVDIAFPAKKLAIEVDGLYHSYPCQELVDKSRDARLQTLGWLVLRAKSPKNLQDQNDILQHWLGDTTRT